MAVEIVDEKPDPSVIKEVVCKHCGTRLRYAPIDVKETHGTDYGGGPDGMTWVDCPKCGRKAVIRSW